METLARATAAATTQTGSVVETKKDAQEESLISYATGASDTETSTNLGTATATTSLKPSSSNNKKSNNNLPPFSWRHIMYEHRWRPTLDNPLPNWCEDRPPWAEEQSAPGSKPSSSSSSLSTSSESTAASSSSSSSSSTSGSTPIATSAASTSSSSSPGPAVSSSSSSLPPTFCADAYPAEAFEEGSLKLYPGSSLLAAFFQRQSPVRFDGVEWKDLVHTWQTQQQQQQTLQTTTTTGPGESSPSPTPASTAATASSTASSSSSSSITSTNPKPKPTTTPSTNHSDGHTLPRVVHPSVLDKMFLCELHNTEFGILNDFWSVQPGELIRVGSTSKRKVIDRNEYRGDPSKLDEKRVTISDAPPPPPSTSVTSPSPSPIPPTFISPLVRDRCEVFHASGFDVLLRKKVVNPAQNYRELILIDPPYETGEEMRRLMEVLPKAYKKGRSNVWAIWYPLIEAPLHSGAAGSMTKKTKKVDELQLKSLMLIHKIPKVLCVEFSKIDAVAAKKWSVTPEVRREMERRLPVLDDDELVDVDGDDGMNLDDPSSASYATGSPSSRPPSRGLGMVGTGVLIINPPYRFEQQLKRLCGWLADALAEGVEIEAPDGVPQKRMFKPQWKVEWITPERFENEDSAADADAPSKKSRRLMA